MLLLEEHPQKTEIGESQHINFLNDEGGSITLEPIAACGRLRPDKSERDRIPSLLLGATIRLRKAMNGLTSPREYFRGILKRLSE